VGWAGRQALSRVRQEDVISTHRAAPAPSRRRFTLRLADVRTVLRLVALTMIGGLLVWALFPYAIGWRTTLVISGSMEPKIRTGDLVVLAPMPLDTARNGFLKGAVVQVDNPVHPGQLLLHRVVARDSEGSIITKGDANQSRDYAPVKPEHVRGVARLRVPLAGLPIMWLRRGEKVPLGALGLTLLVLAWPERRQQPSPAPEPA
jgi:signal peptidase